MLKSEGDEFDIRLLWGRWGDLGRPSEREGAWKDQGYGQRKDVLKHAS